MKLVIATSNKGKFKEFKKMLSDLPVQLLSLMDFPGIIIDEKGSSFEENAILKALETAKKTGLPSLGDDSGLEVEALNGRPGIFTARYAGEKASSEENIKKLLFELEGVPFEKRKAQFVCYLCFALPDGRFFTEKGILKGYITLAPYGSNGFGYDPVFYVPELGKTLAELDEEVKNKISHRGNALEKLRRHILCELGY